MTSEPAPARAELRRFVVGALATNCYALVSDGDCLVVDPGADGAALARELADVRVTLVVATHRHHDHVGGVRALCEATGAPFAIGAADAARVPRALELSTHDFGEPGTHVEDPPVPDLLLHEGDELGVGEARLRVIDAPGHTEGGIVLLGEGAASGLCFVGDTIFPGSHGRCDLLGGDEGAMRLTLRRLARAIPAQTLLLVGHGDATTMARELERNPFMAPWGPGAAGKAGEGRPEGA